MARTKKRMRARKRDTAKRPRSPARRKSTPPKPREKRSAAGRREPAPVKMESLAIPQGLSDPTLENLAKVDHIIVLMMENRSFDHLMGYLKLENILDVDGLTPDMSNNLGSQPYPVHL